MWYSNVLVAYDGSNSSKQALKLAAELSQAAPQAHFTFVYIARLSSDAGASGAILDEAGRVVRELEAFAQQLSGPAQAKLLEGSSPADVIAREGRELGCDLIVMGSRGKGGVKGYLGSVSYAVLKQARCCVLIAKEEAVL